MSKKKYTISEVSNILEYEPHLLRYYEKEFKIKIPRNRSNHRYFTYKEIEIYEYIKQLKAQGYNNNQIKKIMESPEIDNEYNNNESNENNDNRINNNIVSTSEKEISININNFNNLIQSSFQEVYLNIEKMNNNIEEIKALCTTNKNDILLSENAKLKLKLKEKTYELIEVKERYQKLEKKKFIFRRFVNK